MEAIEMHAQPTHVYGRQNGQSVTHMLNEMKSISKARLQRQVFADPGMARELVAMEASPVYNARAEVTQALSTRHFQA